MVAGSREARAIEMLDADPDGVRKIGSTLWKVRSQSGGGWYTVEKKGRDWVCDCPDFEGRGDGEPCKHVFRVYAYWFPDKDPRELLRPPATIRKSYPQVQPGYDRAQMAELSLAPVFLKDAIASLVPSRDGPRGRGRPAIPLEDRIYCAIERVHWQLSCRRAYGITEEAARKGFVSRAWNYGTASEALLDEEVTPYLDQLLAITAAPFAALDDAFAIDSSGFRTTCFGEYRREKYMPGRRNIWVKGHPIVAVKSHVVPALIVTEGEGADSPQFPELLRRAKAAGFTIKEVSADKAYLSRDNFSAAESMGAFPFIPFKSNSTGESKGSGIYHRMFHWVQAHPDEFAKGYFKRENVESLFSAVKRMLGETLRSKLPVAQGNELRAKFAVYNVTVLIHGLYEANLVPPFLRPLWPGPGFTSDASDEAVDIIPVRGPGCRQNGLSGAF